MNVEQKKEKIVYCLISLLITLAYISILAIFYDFRFDLNDDMTIRDILSGAYAGTPDAHAVYIQFPLALLISLLYKLTGGFIPWFSVLIMLGNFGSFTVLNYNLLRNGNSQIGKILFTALNVALWISFFSKNLIFTQYTVTSAVLASTGIALILILGKASILSYVLMLLSFMLRTKMAILSLPFLILAILFSIALSDKTVIRSKIKSLGLFVGILLLSFVACYITHLVYYHFTGYDEYLKFNGARTELYDYLSIPEYEEYKKIYDSLGITYDEYSALVSYDLDLNTTITTEKMSALSSSIHAAFDAKYTLKDYRKLIYEYVYNMLHPSDQPFIYGLVLFYALLVMAFIINKNVNKWGMLFIPILVIGRTIIWIYIMYCGRYPTRITDSLNMIELLLLLGMVFRCDSTEKKSKIYNACLGITVLLTLLSACISFKEINRYRNEVVEKQTQYSINKLENISNIGIYLLDVYSYVGYTEKMFKLGNESKLLSYSLAGGWLARSPLQNKRLIELEKDGRTSQLFVIGSSVSPIKDGDFDWTIYWDSKRITEATDE